MKKGINKFVLAGMVAAGVSCLSPLAFAVEKQPASGIDPDVESTLGISEDHNKQMDDLNREKELLELQSSLSKLKLEKEKTEVDLKKLKGQPVAVSAEAPVAIAATPDFSQMSVPMQEMGGFSNQGQAQASQRKAVVDSPLDRVYVTRIYGIGGVKNVTAYYENGIFTGAAGDEIVSGLRIVKVTDNGAVFSYKGKTKSVNLTTQGLAYSRSQTKQREVSQSAPSGSGNAGYMPNMATEIGANTIIPPPHPR